MQSPITIDTLPHKLLSKLNGDIGFMYCAADYPTVVTDNINIQPQHVDDMAELNVLDKLRRDLGIYSITLTVLRLTTEYIKNAVSYLDDATDVIKELEQVKNTVQDVYVVYCITHFNKGPLGELTVSIGGDCYRQDQTSLTGVLHRTVFLSQAMLRKSVLVFPDIPALHGAKKGEWIVVDGSGVKIDTLSEKSLIMLGSIIIPLGISFINLLKERNLIRQGIFLQFPDKNYIRPDTSSPDVLSGKYWDFLCRIWNQRKVSLTQVTCIPRDLGGPLSPSSRPTGYGIAEVASKLSSTKFSQELRNLQVVVEALGGVSTYAIEYLIENLGMSPDNIIAFDPNEEACNKIQERFGIKHIYPVNHNEFYTHILVNHSPSVWINNGLGNNTDPSHIHALLVQGVKVFCGAANNLLKIESKQESLEVIFDKDAWIWPDEASSGGGWTLAVVDLYRRCQGQHSGNKFTDDLILQTITKQNGNLIDDTFKDLSTLNGENIWQQVSKIIDQRVSKALKMSVSSLQADVQHWHLSKNVIDER